MRYALVTFGCRVNQADSTVLEEGLRLEGGTVASTGSADLIVVNTCSVTGAADQGARQTIRRLARLNPHARIVVTGCSATRQPAALADLPGVAAVVSNDRKAGLPRWAANLVGPTTAERYGGGAGSCGALQGPEDSQRTCYTLGVQTGCDEPCTYCIIPRTRGRGRSVPVAEVVARAIAVERAGYREVALTGVHLGSYGRDLAPPSSLCALVGALLDATCHVRYRISSLEPLDCPRTLIDRAVASPRVAPHFHLPLQHASDSVLAAMRRPYRIDDYRRLVDGIREALPHAAIGTDVIAGFPGERDADFARTADYLRHSPLTSVHVFPYSDRPGTAATRLPDKVLAPLVRERSRLLREVGGALSARFRAAQRGQVRPGLTLEDGSVVLTDNYLKVRVPPGLARNRRVDVSITRAGETLEGTVVRVDPVGV